MAKSQKAAVEANESETVNELSVLQIMQQLAVSMAQIAERIGEKTGNSDMQPAIEKLSTCMEKLTDDADMARKARKAAEKSLRHSLEHDIRLGKVESALLQDGENVSYYKVHMGPREPMMVRIVGVPKMPSKEAEAMLAGKKFERFFGLIGYTEIGVGPIAEALESLPSLEDEGAWPRAQLAGILTGRRAQEELAAMGTTAS